MSDNVTGAAKGGADSAYRHDFSEDVKAALVDSLGMGSEGKKQKKDVKNPTFVLNQELWPPYFVKGSTIEFLQCTSETALPGDFIVVRVGVRLTVCRLIEWRFDGSQIGLYVVIKPTDRKAKKLLDGMFVGKVVSTGKGDLKRSKPNNRSDFVEIWGSLTKFGTCNCFVGLGYILRDAWLVLTTKKEKQKKMGFWEMWRNVRRWHLEEMKRKKDLEDKKKAVEEEERAAKLKAQQEIQTLKPNSWWKDQK